MKLRNHITLLILVLSLVACAKDAPPPPAAPVVTEVISHVDENKIPGTHTQAWEEPMYNQIRVPGQLDPTNTYYRPPHKTIVEIRPGRVQPQQFPADEPVEQR